MSTLDKDELTTAVALVGKVVDVINAHCAETKMPTIGAVSCLANVLMMTIYQKSGYEFTRMLVESLPLQGGLIPEIQKHVDDFHARARAEVMEKYGLTE